MKSIRMTVILCLFCSALVLSSANGSEFQINTYTTHNQSYSSIAYDGTNYMVTWNSYGQDGNSDGIYGQLVDTSGEKIGSEFRINTYTSSNQSNPSLAFDGTNYLVTWNSFKQDSSLYGIYGQLINTSGSKVGSEFRINTYTTDTQYEPLLAFDGNNYLVTWNSYGQDGNYDGIYGQLISKAGAKTGSEFRINTYTTSSQSIPSITFGGNNYLVTWQSNEQDSNGQGIYGQLISASGNKVGSEFRINTYTTGNQQFPALAYDGTNYLVTWQSDGQDGNLYGIYGQLVSITGEKVGSEFQISTYTTNNQQFSALAYGDSYYLVTWQSTGQDGSSVGIYGQFISIAGAKIGSEFLINTYTTDGQLYPTLAYDGNNFLVTWESFGQDGNMYGIYGKFVAGSSPSSPVPEPASHILLGCGVLFLKRRFVSRK